MASEGVSIVQCRKLLKGLITLLFTCFCSLWVSAEPSASDKPKLEQVIEEAWDYIQVKPQFSLSLLAQHSSSLKQAPEYYKFLYYRVGFWASAYLYDTEKTAYFATAMAQTKPFPEREQHLSELLYSLSTWYRRSQQYAQSIDVGRCAISQAKTAPALMRVAISTGNALMLRGEYKEAEQVFNIGLKISEEQRLRISNSVIRNSLAVMHLLDNNNDKAKLHLLAALKVNEALARANGTAINLINLMLVFYHQQDWISFERILNRANRASKSLASEDINHYFFWLKTAYEIQTQQPMTPYQATELLERHSKIREPSILLLLAPIVNDLKLNVTANSSPVQAVTIDFKRLFPMCQQNQLNNLTLIELLLAKKRMIETKH